MADTHAFSHFFFFFNGTRDPFGFYYKGEEDERRNEPLDEILERSGLEGARLGASLRTLRDGGRRLSLIVTHLSLGARERRVVIVWLFFFCFLQ